MIHRWAEIGAVGVALACSLAACSADETGDGDAGSGAGPTSSTGEGTGGASPGTYGPSPCGECVHEACIAAFDACSADPECPAYAECLDACPVTAEGDADPTCEAACPRGTGSESKRAAAAIGACRDPGPGAGCEECHVGERPAVPPFDELNQTCTEPPPEDESQCFKCQDVHCCETQVACNGNPACAAIKACVQATPPGDEIACIKANPEGAEDWARGIECTTFHCAGTCCGSACGFVPCYQCMFDECGLEWAAHVRTADGYLFQKCIQACAVDDVACDSACFDEYPGAYDAYADLAECLVVTGCAAGPCAQ